MNVERKVFEYFLAAFEAQLNCCKILKPEKKTKIKSFRVNEIMICLAILAWKKIYRSACIFCYTIWKIQVIRKDKMIFPKLNWRSDDGTYIAAIDMPATRRHCQIKPHDLKFGGKFCDHKCKMHGKLFIYLANVFFLTISMCTCAFL